MNLCLVPVSVVAGISIPDWLEGKYDATFKIKDDLQE